MNSFQEKQLRDLIEWDKMIMEQSKHWWTLWGLTLYKEKAYSKEQWAILKRLRNE